MWLQKFFKFLPLHFGVWISLALFPLYLGAIPPATAQLDLAAAPALSITLEPGWHMYAPGTQQGMAPLLTFNQEVKPQWPSPHFQNQQTRQYVKSFKIPLDFKDRPKDSWPWTGIKGKLSYLVCNKVCVPLEQEISMPEGEGSFPWAMAGIAFLGGLLLNLMPCILPILSLKIFNALQKRNHSLPHIRRGFLAMIAGSFCFFLLLLGFTIGLKSLGAHIGWGLHFQEPLFIAILSVLLIFFLASMWGAYDLRLGIRGSVSSPSSRLKYIEDFMMGFLMTLMATPCTAPFLGTAVAFALTQTPFTMACILGTLWIGFSLPMMVFALFPGVMQKFPKPGKWMVVLERLLGGALGATILWLWWVFERQTGPFAVTLLGVGSILLYLALWKYKKPWKGLIILMVVGVTLTLSCLLQKKPQPPLVEQSQHILQLAHTKVHQGNMVLIEVSADWCLTCKTNHLTVLDRQSTQDLLREYQVKYYYLDWTRNDPFITQFLQSHGRAGIPFYILYGPHAPQGIVLPELLTISILKNAIQSAA